MNKIRVVVWGENVHEQRSEAIRKVYPEGIHQCIANGLSVDRSFEVGTATLQNPEHGLSETRLSETDVLLWWGHIAHAEVADEIVDRVQKRVLEGMGLIVLHSGHYSKVFKRLMGTTCSLIWREAGEKERLWVCNPGHPIAQGIKTYFEIPHEEMYGNHSESPLRRRPFLFPGLREAKSFGPVAAGSAATAKSFIFVPVTNLFRPIANRKSKLSFETPSIGWPLKAHLGSTHSKRKSFSGRNSAGVSKARQPEALFWRLSALLG